METGHRFEIGGLVTFAVAVSTPTDEPPYPYIVVARVTEEHAGGRRLLYRIQGHDAPERLIEQCELLSYERPG